MADSNVVALHSMSSGTKHLALPDRSRVTDLVTGDCYAENTDHIVFEFSAPETRVYLIEPS